MNHVFLATALSIAAVLAGCAAPTRISVYPQGTPGPASSGSGESIVVAKGDTLYGIARRHGVALNDLAEWNCTPPPHVIRPGQRIVLSSAHREECGRAPAVAGNPATPSSTASAASPSAAGATAATATSLPPATWHWPAEGSTRAVRQSGTVTGIEIQGASESPVRAVRDGVVLYSGSGSPGREEMIVLKHEGNWVSSYAHNRQRLVSEGQWVRAGAVIARMGDVGTDRTKLHFELRHQGEPVDPLRHLPSR